VRPLRVVIGAAVLLVVLGSARAQDFKRHYVGKSSCAPNIQSKRPDFSMALDRTQMTYVIHRYLPKATVLLIVQLQVGDNCGVIRDVIELRDLSKEFEFSCVDYQSPGDVVIGTGKRNGSTNPLTANEAWRIDLKEHTFNKIGRKVVCTIENYAGEDDGSDLAAEAKKRASEEKSGHPRPAPNH